MKLVNFEMNGATRPGVVRDGVIFEIPSASSVEELVTSGRLKDAGVIALSKGTEVEKAKLKAPVLSPDKILLAAVNYKAHGAEQKTPPPEKPYFFTKFRSCIIGNGDPIIIPRTSKKADWEGELAVVIGKKGKYVGKKEALEHVAGYTVANDVSFRDLQFPEGWPTRLNSLGQNWVMGKGLDSALPMGP